jgi:hypothetical protein
VRVLVTFMYKVKKIQHKTIINYYILTPHDVFSVCFHCSLLGYHSKQWVHLYNVSTKRFLVTNLNYHFVPTASAICGVKIEHSGLKLHKNP